MRILVLGGTVFLGRHFVEAALSHGHELTLLHRGERGKDLFPEVDRVFTNRDEGLDALGDRSFEAVVDTSGYIPRVVRQSARALKDRTGRYLFVSTISVYDDPTATHLTEDSRLAELEDPSAEEVNGETYGGLKVLCEREVLAAYGDRALVVRPGLIVGPWDPTNRFTYWVDRMARGGDVLVPQNLQQPSQVIDVRDLAAFMVHALEQNLGGIYNATGPADPITLGDVFEACKTPTARLVPVSFEFLDQHGVQLWQELPLALPNDPAHLVGMRTDSCKAIAAGLRFRDLGTTVSDTREWSAAHPPFSPRHGLAAEKEQRVLEAWRQRT